MGLAHTSDAMVRCVADISMLDAESRRILSDSGLPKSAAPCLSFGDCATLPRVWEVFSPKDWENRDRSHLTADRMLGSDGAGNPICVNENTGEVCLLDHEDRFRTRQFVNSTVAKLAECLLRYRGATDEDAFRAAVLAVDPQAMADGSFWNNEAKMLRFVNLD